MLQIVLVLYSQGSKLLKKGLACLEPSGSSLACQGLFLASCPHWRRLGFGATKKGGTSFGCLSCILRSLLSTVLRIHAVSAIATLGHHLRFIQISHKSSSLEAHDMHILVDIQVPGLESTGLFR